MMKWTMSQINAIIKQLEEYEKIIDKTLKNLCNDYAADMEYYAKTNKKWKTRTGQAEAGLVGDVNFEDGKHSAMICQNMFGLTGEEYGYYLEFAERFKDKYAILKQTTNHFYQSFFKDAEEDLKEALEDAKLGK